MCGLAGVIGTNLGIGEFEAFQELMTISTIRGKEGAGVATAFKNGEIKTHRTMQTGAHLVYGQRINSLSKELNNITAFSGHCRWPTKGGNHLGAVHPHIHNKLVGVHNGTLTFVRDKWVQDGVSDSAELIKAISEDGIDKAIKECRGAYALVLLDQEKNTLSFLRNSQRPLWFAHPKGDTETIYWASEKNILEFVLTRRYRVELVYKMLDIDKLTVFSLDVAKGVDIQPEEEREIRQYTPVLRDEPAWWESDDWKQKNNNQRTVYPISHYLRGKYGTATYETCKGFYVTEEVLEHALKVDGCVWCGHPATRSDYNLKKIEWVANSTFICNDCGPEAKAIDFNFKGMLKQ